MGMRKIHEEVPYHSKSKKDKLVEVIPAYLHKMMGKRNAMLSSDIMRMIGLSSSGTNETLRAAMKVLLVEQLIPICSCSKGFYVATNDNELKEYVEDMNSRIEGLERNKEALGRCREKMNDRMEQRSLLGG